MPLRISDHIQVFQSALWQLNSTHIHFQDTSIVFDPAYLPFEINAIASQANNPVWSHRYLIYTHGDFDHIVGNHWFEGFEQLGSLAMAKRNNTDHILSQINTYDQENYITRPHPVSYPELNYMPDVKDSLSIKLGSVELILFKASGHTSDGLFYIIPELKLWIAGDYLSDIEFPFIEDSLKEYYDTLERADKIINEFDIDFLVPGHGTIAFTKSEMISRLDKSINYLNGLAGGANPDWRASWGHSPFEAFLDKMHRNNLAQVLKIEV